MSAFLVRNALIAAIFPKMGSDAMFRSDFGVARRTSSLEGPAVMRFRSPGPVKQQQRLWFTVVERCRVEDRKYLLIDARNRGKWHSAKEGRKEEDAKGNVGYG